MENQMIVALGYLTGAIDARRVTPQKLRAFVTTDWSKVPDGKPALLADSDATQFLAQVARAFVKQRQADRELVESLQEFGRLFALGQVTMASLALLCDCSVSDFDPA